MKISKYKKQRIIVLHLLFWLVSICTWAFVLNPGGLTGLIGLDSYWPAILLLNVTLYNYCLLPLIWFTKIKWIWVKISHTLVFLIPIGYILYLNFQYQKDIFTFYTDFFVANFGYTLVFHLTIISAVYFNLKVLIPWLLNRGKLTLYLASLAGLTLLTAVVNFSLFDYCIDKIFPDLFFISYFKIWELVIIIGLYLTVTLGLYLAWQYNRMLIANRQKAQNELSVLKAQINPHFLFNNLNTIYSMASKNDVRTKDVILQLSDFLRYVLYDTSNDWIPLEKEVDIIRKYVDLQRERINPAFTQIILNIDGHFENVNIAPLLLIPLAENCFKHGIGKKPGKIEIFIGFNGKELIFTTVNVIALRERTDKNVTGGIGITNVENRLNLLYPNRYSFHYEDVNGIFKLELKIKL